jgi:hypothetical protein
MWLWRPSVRRYNRARVSLRALRKQPFQQTRVRWGDFPLIPNLINYIKSRSGNWEACLWCPEVFGPPDKIHYCDERWKWYFFTQVEFIFENFIEY